jgi:hypothetical protein
MLSAKKDAATLTETHVPHSLLTAARAHPKGEGGGAAGLQPPKTEIKKTSIL